MPRNAESAPRAAASGTSAGRLFREPRSLTLVVLSRRSNLASLTLPYRAELLQILTLTDFVVAERDIDITFVNS
jgi:hypothetical protein